MAKLDDLKKLIKEGYSKGRTFHKLVATAGTPEKLVEHSEPSAVLLIKALRTNTGYIEVGFDGITTLIGRGHELEKKEIQPQKDMNFERTYLRINILIKFQDNQMKRVRKSIRLYSQRYGFEKNLIIIYLASFIPYRLTRFVKSKF